MTSSAIYKCLIVWRCWSPFDTFCSVHDSYAFLRQLGPDSIGFGIVFGFARLSSPVNGCSNIRLCNAGPAQGLTFQTQTMLI